MLISPLGSPLQVVRRRALALPLGELSAKLTEGENWNNSVFVGNRKNTQRFLSLRQKSSIFATSLVRGRLSPFPISEAQVE